MRAVCFAVLFVAIVATAFAGRSRRQAYGVPGYNPAGGSPGTAFNVFGQPIPIQAGGGFGGYNQFPQQQPFVPPAQPQNIIVAGAESVTVSAALVSAAAVVLLL